jgi:hypothetical protein
MTALASLSIHPAKQKFNGYKSKLQTRQHNSLETRQDNIP